MVSTSIVSEHGDTTTLPITNKIQTRNINAIKYVRSVLIHVMHVISILGVQQFIDWKHSELCLFNGFDPNLVIRIL